MKRPASLGGSIIEVERSVVNSMDGHGACFNPLYPQKRSSQFLSKKGRTTRMTSEPSAILAARRAPHGGDMSARGVGAKEAYRGVGFLAHEVFRHPFRRNAGRCLRLGTGRVQSNFPL
jgi:hypothetical protein